MKSLILLNLLITIILSIDIQWSSCDLCTPFTTTHLSNHLSNEDHLLQGLDPNVCEETLYRAECSSIEIPLDWDRPQVEIDVFKFFVKRIFPVGSRPVDMLWMLQGGPGGSGAGAMERLGVMMARWMGNVTVYVPDHRGTGRSFPIECDNSIEKCAGLLKQKFGSRLDLISTTQAARDIGEIINVLKTGNEKVMVYGTSYGTYWLNRYSLLYPNQADSLVLDSVCPPDRCHLRYYSHNQNLAGLNFLNLCGEQSELCRRYLGSFPSEIATSVFQDLQQNQLNCSFNIESGQLSRAFGAIVKDYSTRLIIPAAIKRLYYCSPSDQKELRKFLSIAKGLGGEYSTDMGSGISFSMPTAFQIGLSEIFDNQKVPVPLFSDIFAQEQTYLMTDYLSAQLVEGYYNSWPRYTPDKYHYQYTNTSAKALIIHGTLDPQTNHMWFLRAKKQLSNRNNFEFVSVPYGVHTLLIQGQSTNFIPCGAEMITSFFQTGKSNTTCLTNWSPPDFEGTTENIQTISDIYFGTKHLWGEESTPNNQ